MQECWWNIDRHRLTAADLEDSIQALLGENEEEAVQRFLDHTGKISEGIIRPGPISLWIVISFFCSLTISHKCEEKTITVQKRYEHHYHHLACWSLMWDGVFNFHNHLSLQNTIIIWNTRWEMAGLPSALFLGWQSLRPPSQEVTAESRSQLLSSLSSLCSLCQNTSLRSLIYNDRGLT